MKVYVYRDQGKKETFYFSDGANKVTEKSYTYKQMLQYSNFLIELGIKVEDRW